MVPSQYITAAEQYKTGTQLTLWQYAPVQPHGLSQYTRNPLPPDLPPGCIRNFDLEVAHDTNKEEIDKQAVLQVNKVICGGDNNTVQVVLFDILKAPVSYRGDAARLPEDGTQVVGLLYDTEFYPATTAHLITTQNRPTVTLVAPTPLSSTSSQMIRPAIHISFPSITAAGRLVSIHTTKAVAAL